MKNVLFATTALVAFAGAAAAEVTVGGYGYAGVIYDEGAADQTYVSHAVRLTFSASVETSSGVTFGAASRITISDNNDNGMLGHNKITMKAGGLSVALGATHGAMKTLARTATFHGFNDGSMFYLSGGAGIDNNVGLGDGGNNLLVRYDSGAFSVAAAADVAGSGTYELAAKYTTNGFSVGVGADNNSQWQLALGYSAGNLAVGLGTNDNSDIVVTANYAINSATAINFGYDSSAAGDAYGIQVSHDLGGASLIGNIGQDQAGNSIAGLGVFFSF